MRPIQTWIILINGNHARFARHIGVGNGLEEITSLEMLQDVMKAQDIDSDRPGRAFASGSAGRSAMESTSDPVARRELDFITDLSNTLSQKAQAKEFDRLVIIAEPRALGAFRKVISPRLAQLIYAEIDKDLTNLPISELSNHLESVLVV